MKLAWLLPVLLSIATAAIDEELATETTQESIADVESETEHYQVLLAKSAVAEQENVAEEQKPLPKKDICLTRHCVSAAHRLTS